MSGLVSTRRASELSGASLRQIGYWQSVGLVQPSVPAAGSGSRCGWSAQDVLRLRVIVQLLAHGAGISTAALAADCAESDEPGRWLLVSCGGVYKGHDPLGSGCSAGILVDLDALGTAVV